MRLANCANCFLAAIQGLLLSAVAAGQSSAAPSSCGQIPYEQYRECTDRVEAVIIKKWPQYFQRSMPKLSDTNSGIHQQLVFQPRSGNAITLVSYFPKPGANDEANIANYRLADVFPKLDLAYVTVAYYESIHHFYYRLSNGEQIIADGEPNISPHGERMLVLACGESALGRVEPIFDVFEKRGGWVKRVYQMPHAEYPIDSCPAKIRWVSKGEISFTFAGFNASEPDKTPARTHSLRHTKQGWKLF
jgi:hypothetical protein